MSMMLGKTFFKQNLTPTSLPVFIYKQLIDDIKYLFSLTQGPNDTDVTQKITDHRHLRIFEWTVI
jgi:hypothetical protein